MVAKTTCFSDTLSIFEYCAVSHARLCAAASRHDIIATGLVTGYMCPALSQ